ncbi:MAG: hypothetical protein ORN51_06550, partial [Akkermansiaceae bacterium]|nr:hypothetical protein [Akkermansiaceae bacterium]
ALRDYAEQAENGGGFQRRLFAEDAARGFAFIDVCRKRYDVALMNPPFGDTTEVAGAYLAANFGKFSNNLLCSFLARGRWLCPGGAVGAISDSTWLKKADYEDFREFLLAASNGLRSLIDLGWGVLDGANVATCCFTSIASNSTDNRVTSIRAVELELDDKEPAVLATLIYLKGEGSPSRAPAFVRNLSFFEKFPGKAIAYETHDALVPLFLNWKPLEPEFATTRRGYTPGDTFRFFRCWWEVSIEKRGSTWWTLNNGGAFAPVVGDGLFVALHEPDWASYRPLTGFRLESEQWFGKAGLGWGKRTDFMYVYPLPAGSMFSNEGHSAFPTQARYTWPLIAYLNSDVGQTLLNLFCGQHKLAGYVAQLPSPDLDSPALKEAGKMAQSIWRGVAFLQTRVETAEHFVASVRLGETPTSIVKSYISTASWYEDNLRTIDAMIAATIAGVSLAGANQVGFAVRPKTSFSKERPESGWIDEIISFALGCSLGRWDIRYATGEQAAPELPDPFAPLPVCPPGQLQNAQGLPARPEDVPAAYPIRIPWDGILVDDPNHPLDIERRVREVIEIIWNGQEGGPTAEAIEHEACEILGVKSLRDYFRKPAGFFADHLKRYSKSRRQAPIYWPLATASGSYTLWIYYHRLTNDTLYAAVTQFVEPRIEEAKQTHARLHEKGDARSKAEDKTYEETTQFIGELATFREELLRIAGFWKPNLNDGVLITAAPLWSLFALKPWQKKLKETWQALEKGNYDWAHLAYSIWPERVAKACEKDRSIAIAHGLEHLCKVEPPKAKKKAKSKAAAVEVEMDPELIGDD